MVEFTRKLFSFFAVQKIVVALFQLFTYNYVKFTKFIAKSIGIFLFAAIFYLLILFLVHTNLEFIRKSPQSYISFIVFTICECWVIGWTLGNTDQSMVFLFAGNLCSNILAISIFLHTNKLSWIRGLGFLLVMSLAMFVLSMCTLNYASVITILVSTVGGLCFGVFLLYKAFTILENKYTHSLCKEDFLIGSLTIYLDFGFILLILLFALLAMIIKSFTNVDSESI